MAFIIHALRAVEQAGIADAGVDDCRRMLLDRVNAAPDLHHFVDVMLDEFHRGHHLADALAGEILEVTRLENADHALLNVFAELGLLIQRAPRLVAKRTLIDALAASGVKDFGKLLSGFTAVAPMHRAITIEEVGNAAAFLLSDLAGYVTGQTLLVDGGLNLRWTHLGGDNTSLFLKDDNFRAAITSWEGT